MGIYLSCFYRFVTKLSLYVPQINFHFRQMYCIVVPEVHSTNLLYFSTFSKASHKYFTSRPLYIYLLNTISLLNILLGVFNMIYLFVVLKTKKASTNLLKPFSVMVGDGRLELPTSCLSSMRSEPTELITHLC